MKFFEGHSFGRRPAQALKILDNQARLRAFAKGLSREAEAASKALDMR